MSYKFSMPTSLDSLWQHPALKRECRLKNTEGERTSCVWDGNRRRGVLVGTDEPGRRRLRREVDERRAVGTSFEDDEGGSEQGIGTWGVCALDGAGREKARGFLWISRGDV